MTEKIKYPLPKFNISNSIIKTNKSELIRFPQFIPKDNLMKLTQACLQLPLVERPEIKVYGKICRQQRNVGFFARPDITGYKYSGQQTEVINITEFPFLQEIMDLVNDKLKTQFNGILINLYENGEKYIGAHSDDENGLSPVGVASIAFGAVRTFRIRDKPTKQILKDVPHQPGDLLLMSGKFQQEFTHEIPIQKKIKTPRISLTFRLHSS